MRNNEDLKFIRLFCCADKTAANINGDATMQKRAMLVVMIPLLCLLMSLSLVNAVEITSCVLDSEVYLQGQSGYVEVDVYNNMDDKIRVTDITMMIDYFYSDGTVYKQTFNTNSTLPIEILQGQSSTFYIPFMLPDNVAPGYIRLVVRVWTDIWNAQAQRWYMSDNPTAEPVLYIESPYKEQFEQEQSLNAQLLEEITELEASNEQLQGQVDQLESANVQLQAQISELGRQLDELQATYYTTTILMYVFIAATAFLALMMMFLQKFARRTPLSTPGTR